MDVESDLVERILNGDFEDVREVVAGRFHRAYGSTALKQLSRLDTSRARSSYRDDTTVVFWAPFVAENGEETRARVRLVKDQAAWKLEHVSVYPWKVNDA